MTLIGWKQVLGHIRTIRLGHIGAQDQELKIVDSL